MGHRLIQARPLLLACLLASPLGVAGCAAIRKEPEAPPPSGPQVAILSMHEEPAYDPSLVKLVGTIVNRGSEPAVRTSVRVEGRDAQGRALTRVIVPAIPETIPAGGAAAFEAQVPRSSTVHDFHAEVIVR